MGLLSDKEKGSPRICPCCKQGRLFHVVVRESRRKGILCEVCEAFWIDEANIAATTYERFAVHMATLGLPGNWDELNIRGVVQANAYIPNAFSSAKLLFNYLAALALFAYGTYGIYINDLWLPLGPYGVGWRSHFSDGSALLLYAALICGCLILLSVVVDHYDKRNNEQRYEDFATLLSWLGALLFVAASFLHGRWW